MFRTVLTSLLAVLVLCGSAFAAEKTLIAAANPTWPPMEFLDENKNIIGYDRDIIAAIAEEIGMKSEFRNIAWDGIFASLESGQANVIASCVTITDKRKKAYVFSDPYYEVHQAVVVAKDSAIKKPEDLKGLKLRVTPDKMRLDTFKLLGAALNGFKHRGAEFERACRGGNDRGGAVAGAGFIIVINLDGNGGVSIAQVALLFISGGYRRLGLIVVAAARRKERAQLRKGIGINLIPAAFGKLLHPDLYLLAARKGIEKPLKVARNEYIHRGRNGGEKFAVAVINACCEEIREHGVAV